MLCDRQGRPMAALEAKRAGTDPATACAKGCHYAEQLGVPFVFLSDGEEVFQILTLLPVRRANVAGLGALARPASACLC